MTLNQNNDDLFLSLVSAQREILKRLKREKNVVLNKRTSNLIPVAHTAEWRTKLTFGDDSDPFQLMNEPIIERRLDQGELFNKAESQRRISGNDILRTWHVPSPNNFSSTQRKNKRQEMAPTKHFYTDATKSSSTRDEEVAACHDNLRGMFANAFVFDTDSTNTERASIHVDFYNAKKESDESIYVPKPALRRKKYLDSNIDIATFRKEIVSFVVAMEKSMKSQQDIHDWDRKMGLKRSHSKTMRLSMRSRNRLRNIVVNH